MARGLILGFFVTTAIAGERLEVARISQAPIIDGVLDEPIWRDAATIHQFVQAFPQAGADPSRRTELHLASDGQTLFVSIRAFDYEPQAIRAREATRDGIDLDDSVTIVIDPQGTQRNGFFFAINPRGTQSDGTIANGGSASTDWDIVWQSAARIDAKGWTAELAIPLGLLAAPSDGRPWRFNAARNIFSTREALRLFSASTSRDVFDLVDAVPLSGVTAQPQMRSWRFKPRASFIQERGGEGGVTTAARPAFDGFLSTSRGLTASLTLNSSFPEASRDDFQANFDRFELFRSEQRDFFIQDAGRFTFGGIDDGNPNLVPFFSRRIGIDNDGRPQRLDFGLKVAGSSGEVDYGLLATQVARNPESGRAAQAAVLRLATDITERHQVGMLGTLGNPQGTSGSSLLGVDYRFLHALPGNDETLRSNVWVLQSRNATDIDFDINGEGVGRGTADAMGASVSYPNLGWNGFLSIRHIGEDFRPALGFVRESGVERMSGQTGWRARSDQGAEQSYELNYYRRERLDQTESEDWLWFESSWSNPAGDSFSIDFGYTRELLNTGFTVLSDLEVRPGRYAGGYYRASFNTSQDRDWVASIEVERQPFFAGSRVSTGASLGWQGSAKWNIQTEVGRDELRLPIATTAGINREIVISGAVSIVHTPSIANRQSLTLQRDNVSDETLISLRSRWFITPRLQLLSSIDHVRLPFTAERRIETVAAAEIVWDWVL
jgi:hypothetical protein